MRTPWLLRTMSRTAAVTALPLALWAGCAAQRPTELVAGVTTQIQVPKDIKAVGFIIQPAGELAICRVYPVAREPGQETGIVRLPSTLAMQPSKDPKRTVTTTVVGFKRALEQQEFENTGSCAPLTGSEKKVAVGDEHSTVIMRRARTQYATDKILYLPMPLKPSCKDIGCADEETTCKAGRCVKIDVDKDKLKEFREELLFGSASTCFRVNDQKDANGGVVALGCFNKSLTVPAKVVDKANCIYEYAVPAVAKDKLPAAKGINVRLRYSDFNTEVVDLDDADAAPEDQEGFSIPDKAGKPMQFRLAPGLCALTKDDPATTNIVGDPKVIAVEASILCASKTAYQPICDEDVVAIQRNGSDGTNDGSPNCAEPITLKQAPSTLYIAMDRSRPMKPFFGEAGVKQVLDLSLQDPSLRTTSIGFKFLPAPISACTANPNPYSVLDETAGDQPFAVAEAARAAIAARIGDVNNIVATDGNVFWDAALAANGAYRALVNARSGKVNRQAVLLIGNRDFAPHCAGNTSLAAQAKAALEQEKIATYVVVLGRVDDNGTPDDVTDDCVCGKGNCPRPTPQCDAQAADIANADEVAREGGTKAAFNASLDAQEGAKALNTVVNDLASCLYDEDPKLTAGRANIGDYALSYLGFTFDGTSVDRPRIDIPFDPLCTPETQETASGFNLDADGRVRICGLACKSLRDSLSTSAGYAATLDPPQPPPGIDVRVSRRCL